MTVLRMDHVSVVVDDLAAATEFFAELGLELLGEVALEGRSVDRIVGLDGVRTEVVMMQTPDCNGRLELVKFLSPPSQGDSRYAPANTPGLRHLRGPAGIIIELAERIGSPPRTLRSTQDESSGSDALGAG
jgi:catechol 2,3-dioxygenase-like lactoylglutathione lyase family enzyme